MVPGWVAVTVASPVWADVGHGHTTGDKMVAPLWVWSVGLGALSLIVLFLILRARRGTLIGQR
ncbi:MAG: hypothetical protein ACE5FB_07345, partial [Candidatus Binatia bacterium]